MVNELNMYICGNLSLFYRHILLGCLDGHRLSCLYFNWNFQAEIAQFQYVIESNIS